MDISGNKLLLWQPDEYIAARLAKMYMGLIMMSSERYELGLMTEDEAATLLDFAYLPLRYGLGEYTWRNTNIKLPHEPRVWSFGEYYDALCKMSPRHKRDKEL